MGSPKSNSSNSLPMNLNDKITIKDLEMLHDECLKRLRDGELRTLRNDAKLRAINNTNSYEEFKDIVDAAHLNPISKKDKMNAKTKNRLWNTAASETKFNNEN